FRRMARWLSVIPRHPMAPKPCAGRRRMGLSALATCLVALSSARPMRFRQTAVRLLAAPLQPLALKPFVGHRPPVWAVLAISREVYSAAPLTLFPQVEPLS